MCLLVYKGERMTRKKKAGILFTIVFSFVFFIKMIAENYTITITESLPLGIYKLTEAKDIKVGDIVQFSPDEEEMELIYSRRYLPRYAKTLLKEVAADYSNRDEIEIRENIFFKDLYKDLYVSGKNYGPVLKKDSSGRNIEKIDLDELKPKNNNEYLLLSSHFKSYDSRYFGLIRREQILKKAELKIKF